MQFNFFALYSDKIKILEHIFNETEFKVVDHYSAASQDLREYKSVQEISDNFDLNSGKTNSLRFALWNKNYGEANIVRKVDLNPKYCNGHTFRFAATGWSLQHLYFGGISGGTLHYSTLQGFNEKGAIEKDFVNSPADGTAHKLDWAQIKSDQRKLKYFIEKRLTARKHNTYLVLNEADKELQLGHIKL